MCFKPSRAAIGGREGNEDMVYTVFPADPERMPQDFPTYWQAEEYGDAYEDEYTIESTTGECI